MVSDYQHKRLAEGAARNTIRYEVGVLSAAFGVAVGLDKLTVKPAFKQIDGGAVRTGFFEPGEFAALVLALPPELADLVRFLDGMEKGRRCRANMGADRLERRSIPRRT